MTRPTGVTEPDFPFVLRRLDQAGDAAFADLLRLYQEAFPEPERKPTPWLRRMLSDASYHFLLATEEKTTATFGFAIARVLGGNTAALLEYMTIAPSHRGRGWGRRLVLATAHTLQSPPLPLLIETESDKVDTPDLALRTRRKRFYRSLGAREISGLAWRMPQVASSPPPAMELMLMGLHESSISKDQLLLWLRGIYVEVYEQNADDPHIAAMLDVLPDRVALI